MRLAVLVFCCALAFGQSTSSAPGTIDILSDTQGVDFGPYLQNVIQKVRQSWYHLIPESASMKKGKLAIEFAITKDGSVANMRIVASSRGVALDRPAWGRITASNPFPPLPSDRQGMDFRPYLQRIVQTVRENWHHFIPESVQYEKGELAIEFAIAKDGKVTDMRPRSSGDVALDRPAWDSITASNPFPPLPSEFAGPYLALRFRYFYNPDKGDLTIWVHTVSPQTGLPQGQVLPQTGSPQTGSTDEKDRPAASEVEVCIDAPSDLEVPAGGSKIITASVGNEREGR